MGFFDKLKQGLQKTRSAFTETLSGVFGALTKVDEELFEQLEETLICSDVGMETTMYIIDNLRERVKKGRISEPAGVKKELEDIITEILSQNQTETINNSKFKVVLIIGVNGVGKTTTIGKLAEHYKLQGKKVMLAAADTFRAAAIEQLIIWANRSGCDIVSHQQGADPGAVVFDAVCSAKAKNSDVLICDTAGRLHNKKHLMDELAKIFRILEREVPDSPKEVLLVLDATTGQNAISQAKAFCEAVSVSGIVLTKLDGTAKGGVIIGICKELNIPVRYIGVGEGIDDLDKFNASDFAKALFD